MLPERKAKRSAARQSLTAICAAFTMLLVLTLAPLPLALAQSPDKLKGSWAGKDEGGVVVKLAVTEVDLGEPSGEMEWKSPWNCEMQTEYAGLRDGLFVLKVSKTNGGRCDLYRSGSVTLKLDEGSSDRLSFTLEKNGQTPVKGQLDRR